MGSHTRVALVERLYGTFNFNVPPPHNPTADYSESSLRSFFASNTNKINWSWGLLGGRRKQKMDENVGRDNWNIVNLIQNINNVTQKVIKRAEQRRVFISFLIFIMLILSDESSDGALSCGAFCGFKQQQKYAKNTLNT